MKMQTGMNDSQTEEVIRILRTSLRRHRKEFVPMAVQQALTAREFRQELLAPFRRYCGASNTIVRRVKVNHSRSQQEAFVSAAKCRTQLVDFGVVAEIPKYECDDECEVTFFTGIPEGACYADEYARRGLKPANPMLVLAVNEVDETFADNHPNTVEWKTRTGHGYIAFGRSLKLNRFISIGDFGPGAKHDYWYAGVPKTALD